MNTNSPAFQRKDLVGYGVRGYTDDYFDARIGESYLYIDLNDVNDGISRAYDILHGFGDRRYYRKAVGSAMKRAAKHAQTIGYRAATKRYDINSGYLKQFTQYYNQAHGEDEWRFGFRGLLIPLAYYKIRKDSENRIQAHVLRGRRYVTLKNAFLSTGASYNRVRERITKARFPTRQFYGPSAVQGLNIVERETGVVSKAVTEEFDKRIEHEILRIMNGWGV